MSESIENEFKLTGESIGGQLSFTQQAMYDRLHCGIEEYRKANSDIAGRASLVLVASTASFGAIAAVVALPDNPSNWSMIPPVLAAIVSLGIVFLANSLWLPRASVVAGNSNIESMYRTYISKDADDAFYLVMRDAALVYDDEKSQNAPRAKMLFWMTIGLDIQIVLLLMALAITVMC